MLLRLVMPGFVAIAVLILAVLGAAAAQSRRRPAKHRRPRTVVHARPGEMRRHRTGIGTWVGTIGLADRDPRSLAAGPTAPHTLGDRDARGRRYRVTNLVDDTGEITQAGLEALLGERPAELVGASA